MPKVPTDTSLASVIAWVPATPEPLPKVATSPLAQVALADVVVFHHPAPPDVQVPPPSWAPVVTVSASQVRLDWAWGEIEHSASEWRGG